MCIRDRSDAISARLWAQAALADVEWPGPALRVRMGLHLGEAEERGGDYFGPTVNTAARVEAAAHSGQVIVSDAIRLASATEPALDLGEHRLRDVPAPIRLHQLNPGDFPPPRVVPESRSNLPIPPTPLIGREDTTRQVRAMLLDRDRREEPGRDHRAV